MELCFGIQDVLPCHGFFEVIGHDPWLAGADPGAMGFVSNTCGKARDDGNLSLPYHITSNSVREILLIFLSYS